MRWLILICLFGFSACSVEAESEDIVIPESRAEARPDNTTFKDVLAEYQALNSRLEAVSYQLQSANVDLCPRTTRSLGFTVHTVADYPENLQPIARTLLNVGDHLSLRTVRIGSPADQAGLKAGDQIVRLGGTYFPRGRTVSNFYKAAAPRAFEGDNVEITVQRGDNRDTVTAKPESLCGYPVNVFFSERINGHTDGDEVWITSELMRTVPDDVNLALVVAHEMAHAIAGHAGEIPSKRLELEADRMALIMLERAGYDIGRAIQYWAEAPHPHEGGQVDSTHPSTQERLTHFNAVREDIRSRQTANRELDFSAP